MWLINVFVINKCSLRKHKRLQTLKKIQTPIFQKVLYNRNKFKPPVMVTGEKEQNDCLKTYLLLNIAAWERACGISRHLQLMCTASDCSNSMTELWIWVIMICSQQNPWQVKSSDWLSRDAYLCLQRWLADRGHLLHLIPG